MVGQKSKVLCKILNELFGQPNAIYLPVCFPYPGNPKHTIGVFLEYIVAEKKLKKKKVKEDFPGGPVIKHLPCNAGDVGLIPGWGTRIPHAVEQLSPCAPTTED